MTTFADTVRPDLVLVLSELLYRGERVGEVAAHAADVVPDSDLALVRERVEAIGRTYDELRKAMSAGPERARRLEVVASQMRTMAQSTYSLLPELVKSTSAGERLVAVAALQALPDPAYLPWLVERVERERPFVGYHAAVALLTAARTLPDRDMDAVDQAVTQAVTSARRLRPDIDRAVTLANAEDEVRRRRSRLASK